MNTDKKSHIVTAQGYRMVETNQKQNIVVRFAPSPTGYLHIGGARTALFNWLYAKRYAGKFLLRIEDTDRERNNPEALSAILDGLRWLELDWDGDPISQYSRSNRHKEIAFSLLSTRNAYRCYMTANELDSMRKQAEADKKPLTIKSPWRDKDETEAPKDQPFVIRLKAPREGITEVDDRVQGFVTFPNKDLDDLILLRSDGSPTYNLSVVVDDHDMGITHIIRGVDHLTNAARQTQIYNAMKWKIPVWCHVPLIHGSDGSKLSKRHGAQGVDEYRSMGYLPEALRNYLARLGWSHGDDEIISTKQLQDWFDINNINKSAARFDFKKLDDLNAHYIRHAKEETLMKLIRNMLEHINFSSFDTLSLDPKSPPRSDVNLAHEIKSLLYKSDIKTGNDLIKRFDFFSWEGVLSALPSMKERAKTLCDLVVGLLYLIADRPLNLDQKARKIIDAEKQGSLQELLSLFSETKLWTANELEKQLRIVSEEKGLKLGQIAQPLRAALTGRTVSPPVFNVMEILGKEEVLLRLKDQLG